MQRILFTFGLIAQTACAGMNLLENGDFALRDPKTGAAVGWTREIHAREGAAGTITAAAGALHIVNRSPKPAWVRSSQLNVPAAPERLYHLRYRVKGTAKVTVLLYEFIPGDKPYITHRLDELQATAAWATRSARVRSHKEVKSFKLSLITTHAGEAWFDDVELRTISDPPAVVVPREPRRARIGPFFVLGGQGKESAEPTHVEVSYNDEGLRVRVTCRESQVGKMKTTQSQDGMAVFADDCVEVFIAPDRRGRTYYQVGCNARGAKGYVAKASPVRLFRSWHDTGARAKPEPWQPNVPTKAQVGQDQWSVDLVMPWSALNVEPRAGTRLLANVTRRRNLTREENSCWALMTGDTFHDPSQWGSFILAADPEHAAGAVATAEPAKPAPVIPDPRDAKPAFAIRAFHSRCPTQTGLPAYRELVRTLARLKFNTLMLEVNDRMRYERHPLVARDGALSKAELRELVQYCRGLGFDVVPQVQTWGHFAYVLRHERYASLRETTEPRKRYGWWTYCPSNPDTYRLVFDLFEEVIEVFQPKSFHIGHDEITFVPLAQCPRCKGKAGGELFADEVVRLHKWLKGRGLTVMMWGDQLLVEHNGKPPYNTAKALPKIPRDIVMCDWHYSGWADFPSVRFFKSKGFPVIACGWFNTSNVAHFTRCAAEAGAEGYCMTTWWSSARVATTGRTAAAVALTAQFAWAPKRFTLDTLPWHPAQAFRQIHFPPRAPAPCRMLDLSGQANRALEETPVAAAPQGLLSAAGVAYQIGEGAVVLTPKTPSAWQVQVGGRAKSLHFLHCTTRPPQVVDHIYDRRRVLPGRVGRYVVTYVDGSTETLDLRYRRNITQWNSKLGAGECDLAWQGHNADSALVTLCAWEWANPHPDKGIASVDLHRGAGPVDVIVLAITAR